MSADIMEQVTQEIRLSPTGTFTVHLDESRGASSCGELLVFVRCVFMHDLKDENEFYTHLEVPLKLKV